MHKGRLNNYRVCRLRQYDCEIVRLEEGTRPTDKEDLEQVRDMRAKFIADAMVWNEETKKHEGNHKKMRDACNEMTCPRVGNLPCHHHKCGTKRQRIIDS